MFNARPRVVCTDEREVSMPPESRAGGLHDTLRGVHRSPPTGGHTRREPRQQKAGREAHASQRCHQVGNSGP